MPNRLNRTLPPEVKRRKGARPPMPVSKPGFEILVPLELVPEYLRINGLEPKGWDDMRQRLIVTPAREDAWSSLAGVKKAGAQ